VFKVITLDRSVAFYGINAWPMIIHPSEIKSRSQALRIAFWAAICQL